jgi:hypothetical protein
MNNNTFIRMSTIFGTSEGNEEVNDRHIAIHDIPCELMWQANRCHLNGNINVVKLTIAPEVEQPPETREDEEHEFFPGYGVPDLGRFYDEL